jgi:hypothetical protein
MAGANHGRSQELVDEIHKPHESPSTNIPFGASSCSYNHWKPLFFPTKIKGVPVDIPCVQFSEIRPVEAQLLALGLQPAALLAAKR